MAAKKRAPAEKKAPAKRPARRTLKPAAARARRSTTNAAVEAAIHAPQTTAGAPPRPFDLAAAAEILRYVSEGLPPRAACSGTCDLTVLHRWVDENPAFALDLQKAERKHMAAELAALGSANAGQWQRNAWKLERRYPQHWGLKADVRLETTHRFEVSAAVCSELSDSWKAFKAKVIDVVETASADPTSGHAAPRAS